MPIARQKGDSPRRPSATDAKLQRWIDLVAALLSRHYGATFEELRECVPAYRAARSRAAVERMFERDKEELRTLGFPILQENKVDESVYVLRARNLYLPRLVVGRSPAPIGRAGYRAIGTVSFEPDEIDVLFRAALAVKTLGGPALAADATSALQKLTHDIDLPLEQLEPATALPGAELVAAAVMRDLGSALLRRKRVRFTYHSFSSGTVRKREVEPYGLFFMQNHWYLAAYDTEAKAVRNFRLSRMADVEVARGARPDYTVPSGFDLRRHARSREAWELGEEQPQEMLVKFVARSGAARAAAQFGEPVPARGAGVRRFYVRRLDPFVRWILSLGGDAIPLEPSSLVAAYRAAIERTLSIYDTTARGIRR